MSIVKEHWLRPEASVQDTFFTSEPENIIRKKSPTPQELDLRAGIMPERKDAGVFTPNIDNMLSRRDLRAEHQVICGTRHTRKHIVM